jgi:bifunctional non-homologous end joining protein LigD
MLPAYHPVPVIRKPRPFDDSQWLFELKYDGFRALAYLDHGACRLVSCNGHPFASFVELASSIARLADVTTAVFDGEIVCVDAKGRPRFNDLLFRRRDPVFFAFDLLYLNGKDLRCDQLADRKAALRQVLNSRGRASALHYADDVSRCVALYERVCEMDLEGIVAKHKTAPYLSYHAISTWYKIKNPRYSQMAERHELFEQERHREPVPGWHCCELACAELQNFQLADRQS